MRAAHGLLSMKIRLVSRMGGMAMMCRVNFFG